MFYTGKDHLRQKRRSRGAKKAKQSEADKLKDEALRLSRNLGELSAQVERNQNNIDAISRSNEQHINLLTNFMRHDMKNAILNLDTILSVRNEETITDDNLGSLREQVEYIRNIMSNFELLVPSSRVEGFPPHKLISAIKTLHRDIFIEKGVVFDASTPAEVDLTLNYSFTSWLQISTNMVMNAIEHIEANNIANPSIFLEIRIEPADNYIYFLFHDNGLKIKKENKSIIFNYGYSEKNSSGVGLYHINYLCSLYGGKVEVIDSELNGYTKAFMVSLPYKDLDRE